MDIVRERFCHTGEVDFNSAYAHGFARVAACTVPVAIADPRDQRGDRARRRRAACHDEGVAVAIFPELCLTGYAIDDLFLQDVAARRGRRPRSPTSSRRATDLRPVLVVGAPLRTGNRRLQLRGRHPPRAGARRRAEVLPADLPRVLRARAGSPPATTGAARPIGVAGAGGAVRARPALRGHRRARASRCTSRSARTCGCRCRRAPRPRWPARRCWPTSPAARSPWPAPRTGGCWCARRARAASRRTSTPPAGQGESTTDLSWDGQTMVYECGDLLGRDRAVPRRAAPHGRRRRPRPDPAGAAAAGHLRRQPRTRRRRGAGDFRTIEFDARPAGRRHRAAPQGRPLPVRARRRRAARAGLLRGLQHPGLRARAAAARRSASPRSSSASPAASTPPTR